jgi:hypothetical protein
VGTSAAFAVYRLRRSTGGRMMIRRILLAAVAAVVPVVLISAPVAAGGGGCTEVTAGRGAEVDLKGICIFRRSSTFPRAVER